MAETSSRTPLGRVGTAAWGGLFVTGLLIFVLGFIALLSAAISGVLSILYLGALLAVAGIFEFVYAFRAERGERAFRLLGGLLSLVVGALFLIRPGAGLAALTFLLAGFFFVSGLFRLVTSIADRYRHWGWDFAYGLIAMALGTIVFAQWPTSALWLIGTLVGVELLFRGSAMMGTALSMRHVIHHPMRAPL